MLIMRFLHILSAFWLIAGLLGRWTTFAQARRATGIQPAAALLQLSERFEALMVIPGSQAVLLLGLLAAWLGGHPLLGVLQGAGQLAAGLAGAVDLHDPDRGPAARPTPQAAPAGAPGCHSAQGAHN